MALWESLRMALVSLAANKLRSLLTMLGVIIGVTAVVAMVSVGQGAQKRITDQISSLGSNLLTVVPGRPRAVPGQAAAGRGQLPLLHYSYLEEIQATGLPGVEAATAEVGNRATAQFGQANTNTRIVGTTPSWTAIRNFKVAHGRFLTEYDLRYMTRVAILGQTVLEDLFGGDPLAALGQVIRIRRVNFTVIGILEEKQQGFGDQGDLILVPASTAMTRLTGSDYIDAIYVQASSEEQTEGARAALTALLERRMGGPDWFRIIDQSAILETVRNATGTFTLMLAGITSISLLVGGIGIMNIMLVSVTERTREIGIRKAVGAKRRAILSQFVIESTTLSAIGGLVGIALGVGGSRLIARLGSWPAVVSLEPIVIAFLFSAGVGLFFGIYPALKASRLDPIEALRYE